MTNAVRFVPCLALAASALLAGPALAQANNDAMVKLATNSGCMTCHHIEPGGSSIGVVFISKGEIKEYCFSIQEGTTGQVNIFGWRPKLFKAKNILVYKKLSECPGFVVKQHDLNMEYLLKGGW